MAEVRNRIRQLSINLATRPDGTKPRVYGVPRGGVPVALILEGMGYAKAVFDPEDADYFVDDIVDSGNTRDRMVGEFGKPFFAVVDRRLNPDRDASLGWVVFPWERGEEEEGAEENVRRILQVIGEDPDREGLLDTPKRFIKALMEMTEGYHSNPADCLNKSFDIRDADDAVGSYDELILSGPLPFTSLCEHHIALFEGNAWIGYIPDPEGGRVVGLSKLARLLDGYAKRLQIQERLTMQIANDLERELRPLGVGVILKARHTCQCARGVKKEGLMTTSALKGVFKDNKTSRAEFFSLVDASQK